MSESSDGIYFEDYEHHEYCERCHHEMALIVGVESYYDSFYCKNCGMNHPLREMRDEITLWLNCPYCEGDRLNTIKHWGYVCTDCGAEFYPENMKAEQRKAFYLNDFVGFEKYDNQTVSKKETVQKGEEEMENDIVFCPSCKNGHLHELKIKKGFWLCDFCGHLYEKHCEGYYMERRLDCPKCGESKIPYRFSTNHWHCPSCGGEFDSKAMGWDIGPGMDRKFVEFLESLKQQKPEGGFNLYDGYEIGSPMPENCTGKKCLCCGGEIVRGEDGKLACSKCKVVYSGKCNFERGKMVIEGDCKVERPNEMSNYDCYEIGGMMPENYTGKKCLRCGGKIFRGEGGMLICPKCKVIYVERPNEMSNKEKDLNCPGCGIKLKKVAGDNHLYYCVKCGRCYEDAGAFLVSKPLHCKNCGRLILAYNPKEFKYECPKCEATYYPMGEGCDKFQEEFYMGSVTEVKTVPVKDEPKKDAINPQHYKGKGGMQAIDVIEAFGLGFCLGNAVKYILRDGKKDDAVQDLKKAIWYIEREIKNLEAKK